MVVAGPTSGSSEKLESVGSGIARVPSGEGVMQRWPSDNGLFGQIISDEGGRQHLYGDVAMAPGKDELLAL